MTVPVRALASDASGPSCPNSVAVPAASRGPMPPLSHPDRSPLPPPSSAPPMALTGMLASGDGRVVLRHRSVGDQPEELGRAVAGYLLENGGDEFVEWERPTLAPAIDDSQVDG